MIKIKLNNIDKDILHVLLKYEVSKSKRHQRLFDTVCSVKYNKGRFNYSLKKLKEEGLIKSTPVRGVYRITEKGIENIKNDVKEEKEEKWTHTGGVIKLDGLVAKPLIGRHRIVSGFDSFQNIEYKTEEYEALKDLEGISHIPHGVEKRIIDGVPCLIREDLLILEKDDYKTLHEEDLISLEKTIREAHKKGWVICDNIQVAFSEKQGEYVIYDWSNAHKLDKNSDYLLVSEDIYLNRLWEESAFSGYAKAREWANSERIRRRLERLRSQSNIPPKDRKYSELNYTYMSFARPPHWLGIDYPEGEILIEDVKQDERWKPLGLIHTEKPLTEKQIYDAELTPTKYEVM